MTVERAGILGFCMGVRRAVEMARRTEGRVYTLGPLIHNPGVLEDLKEQGISVLKEGEYPGEPGKSTVIIRAHGISPQAEAELVRRKVRIVDATCPHVKSSQETARAFAEKGYWIFLAGEENHGEITGILGYANASIGPHGGGTSPCFVISSPNEAERAGTELFRREPDAKTVLMGQTTFRTSEYRAIAERLKQFFPALEIVNTICQATAERQQALRELCGKVDALIIAGGRESANTLRLLSLARDLGKPAWLVETPQDIPPEIRRYGAVGLSAGASTPDSLIAEIEEVLQAQR